MRRASTLMNASDLPISREIDSKWDVVKAVGDKLEVIEMVSQENWDQILADLEEAKDFTGITAVEGDDVSWNPATRVLTVPRGEQGIQGIQGEQGIQGPIGLTGLRGAEGAKGEKGDLGAQGPIGFKGDKGDKGDTGEDGKDLTVAQIVYNGNGTFTWMFSDGTVYTTPNLIGPKGDTGSKGDRGDQGIGVHHLKGTSTTNANGDFGISPFRDTYTLYADADETINLGQFTVANGVSDGMSMEVYDANANGVVDNSERLGNELPTHYVNVVTNQGIGGTKTFLDDIVVQGSVTVDTLSYNGFGTTSWNADESTLDVVLEGATLQVGQETLVKVRAGTSISNGKVVMATGSIGNSGRVIAGLHDGTVANGKRILGVATQDIANGADGFVTSYGKVRNINTTGSAVGETWVDGDILYVKPNDNGSLTKVVPTDAQLNMPVALVVHAHTNGTLFVRVSGIDENRVATSAKKLETGRTIGMTGDVSWTSGSFDGTGNVTGTATLTNSGVAVGTYDNVTVDVKGRVTAGTNNISADISALVI
jgi:hypothetical protein